MSLTVPALAGGLSTTSATWEAQKGLKPPTLGGALHHAGCTRAKVLILNGLSMSLGQYDFNMGLKQRAVRNSALRM